MCQPEKPEGFFPYGGMCEYENDDHHKEQQYTRYAYKLYREKNCFKKYTIINVSIIEN